MAIKHFLVLNHSECWVISTKTKKWKFSHICNAVKNTASTKSVHFSKSH